MPPKPSKTQKTGFEYNVNGENMLQVDQFLGGALTYFAPIPKTVKVGAFGGAIAGGVQNMDCVSEPLSKFTTAVGTGARYLMGGGLDSYTFKDGSKAYQYSDGDEIMVDKNGKYLGSFYFRD